MTRDEKPALQNWLGIPKPGDLHYKNEAYLQFTAEVCRIKERSICQLMSGSINTNALHLASFTAFKGLLFLNSTKL